MRRAMRAEASDVNPPEVHRPNLGDLQVTEAATTPAAEADAFTPVLAEGTRLLRELGLTWNRLLTPEGVSHATGINAERVALRLAGAPASRERPRFSERLRLLQETRRDRRGKKKSLRKIASEADVDISYAAVAHLLSGRNEPGREVAAALERVFGVPVGWCSLSEGEALAAHIAPLINQLRTVKLWSELQARGVKSVSARSSADLSQMPDLLAALLPTLLSEVDQTRSRPPTGD